MPAPRKLPDADMLHQLRTTGATPIGRTRPATGPQEGPWTYDQIAEAYHVTRAAVHLALQKSGLAAKQVRYDTEIPWKVAEGDNNHIIVNMLRQAARLQRGLPMPEYRKRHVTRWISELKEAGLVVDYRRGSYLDPHPQPGYAPAMQGWGYREAREGIDTGLIRVPAEQLTESA